MYSIYILYSERKKFVCVCILPAPPFCIYIYKLSLTRIH